MFFKTSKRIAVFFLVMCYCLGQMVFPISAGNAENNASFDELLSQRQTEDTQPAVVEKKPVEIGDFTDINENDWFYPYLDYLVGKGMINGKTANTFEPQSEFSYAECSAVIVRYLGLEDEAAKRQKKLSEKQPSFAGIWYAGYFDVLSELGLFGDYGLFETENGEIVSIDKAAAKKPILRYRFAESISESFELDSSLKAKNVFSEMGGSGREFIVGGRYNEEILSQYESNISDYDEIPEDSRKDVLKAYYNGIFNGDISGNFYPGNNLTRAEMAKVLATVSDYSLRTRLIQEGYGQKVTQEMLHTDPQGVKTLDYDVWQKLLFDEAQKLKLSDGFVQYQQDSYAPEGYAVDVYLYEKCGNTYELKSESTMRKDEGFTYWAQNVRILFVMRNVKENSRPEGVLDVRIENGRLVSMLPTVR